MPTVMTMKWQDVTPELYDKVRETVNWEGDTPDGALFHVIWFEDGGARVLDLWDSAEQFQSFVENRLMPGVREAGIEGEPEVQFHDSHRVFAPAYE
jgi:hypothetical protein